LIYGFKEKQMSGSYIALYRKWRPLVFEDVVEQEHVVRTLRHGVSTGRIAHAYLFCGTRGTGKTSMAQIFSRAINCLAPSNGDPCNKCEICKEILTGSSTDVIEIDAASNNSVDNVREIRDEVIYAPSRAKYKVYIIDEVHMLSAGAFNALLKTLEEPPSHVVFILATTEPHKLPATILSRCQRFDFRRITSASISRRLLQIAEADGVKLDEDATRLIAQMSDGALRDAISLLDQCISQGKDEISRADVLSITGAVNDAFMFEFAGKMLDKDIKTLFEKIDVLVRDGKDIPHFISELVAYFRNLLICKVSPTPGDIVDVSPELLDGMKAQSLKITQDALIDVIKELSALEGTIKWSGNPRIMLEVCMVKLCGESGQSGGEDLKAKAAPFAANGPAATPAFTPAPYPTPSFEGKTATDSDIWQDVLDYFKSIGRRAVHAYLNGTRAVELGNGILEVIFNEKNRFGKNAMSRQENISLLEDTVKKVTWREMKIRLADENAAKTSIQPDRAGADADPLAEKARSIAENAGVPIRIIDE
jgi:DNA polymerase-3 subunit gamma/tau